MSALHHLASARQAKFKAARNPAGRLLLIEGPNAHIDHLVDAKLGREETQPRVEAVISVARIHSQTLPVLKNEPGDLIVSP